jgi:hypothetical protein
MFTRSSGYLLGAAGSTSLTTRVTSTARCGGPADAALVEEKGLRGAATGGNAG